MEKTAAKNAVNWFEIACTDLDRACRFYETVLDTRLRREEFQGSKMAVFPAAEPGVAGTLVCRPESRPGAGGSVVYLNVDGKLRECIDRTARAGGKIVVPYTSIGEMGAFALLCDTEGNVVGLHSEA